MISRRQFLQASVSVALIPALPRVAFAATTVQIRPSWQTFCASELFGVFLDTVAAMKANKNTADPASWLYWADTHHQNCPHGKPYFLAWHRGFLKRFEMQLRKVSGNGALVVPYWNYYDDPSLPAEFLDDTSPLWRSTRTGDNVRDALTMDPFADTLVRLPRDKPDAFEPVLETAPHNPVHDLIGGIMTTMSSPLDPLFWVHHANIDRLWAAWVAAGDGRRMPASTNTYWQGSFTYGAAVPSMPRIKTINTTGLGYAYDDETFPASLPPDPAPAPAMRASATTRPATVRSLALGSSQPLALDEHSISVDVLLDRQDQDRVRSLLLRPASGTGGSVDESIKLVLDDVRLTGLGEKGGYFYKVLVNLPAQSYGSRSQAKYLLGTLGPFEIAAARMRMQMPSSAGMVGMRMPAGAGPLRMVFPVSRALREIWPDRLDKLTVSFVRGNGSLRPPRGQVITVGAFRMEAAPNP